MRIPSLQSGLYRPTDLGLATGWALAAQSSSPDRHGSRQLKERVFEGEILPRPLVVEQLLATRPAAPLSAPTTAVPAAAEPQAAPGLHTAKSLFYLLHSSAERLGADPLGRNVDQFV